MPVHDRLKIWRDGADLKVLVGVAVVVLGLCAFFAFAAEVGEGETLVFDEWILRNLRSPTDSSALLGPVWLQGVMRDLTSLGGFTVLSLVTVVTAASLVIVRRYRTSVFVFGAIVVAHGINVAMKQAYARTRPSVVPHLDVATSGSFPSGHSMMSAVVYLTVGALVATAVRDLRTRVFIIAVALLVTFLVGVSRVYLGVHYPSDVIAGWGFGIVWAIGSGVMARLSRSR